jgi:hypothetical protein
MRCKTALILFVGLLSLVDYASADLLCLKSKIIKGKIIHTTKTVTTTSCPKGFSLVADSSLFVGPAGPLSSSLPSGVTMRGNFAVGGTGAGPEYAYDSTSYGFSLASQPTVYVVLLGQAAPAQCPGSYSNPQANPGVLCVYESFALNRVALDVANGANPAVAGASKEGFVTRLTSGVAGFYISVGTWALTAP